jgi:hypothetical protein
MKDVAQVLYMLLLMVFGRFGNHGATNDIQPWVAAKKRQNLKYVG